MCSTRRAEDCADEKSGVSRADVRFQGGVFDIEESVISLAAHLRIPEARDLPHVDGVPPYTPHTT